jgi:nucleoside-diphosphate-sugar epimerase
MAKSTLVTGGTGFLGSALVRRLVARGERVRVLDNNLRGTPKRLADIIDDIELIEGDVRDADTVNSACKGLDQVCHLAFINGTKFFYEKPELVLDVGVKGMVNVLDACRANDIGDLMLMSSSEVYQTPAMVPTPEDIPLSIPDPLNPRYSYAGAKVISELMAVNYGRAYFDRVIIVRPHNVYGPDMGWEHVLPEFVLRMHALAAEHKGTIPFPIQGSGVETRAFVFVDDFIDGTLLAMDLGDHLGIYHVGTREEMSVRDVAILVGEHFGRAIDIIPGKLAKGGTPRRCPDIAKVAALGYAPKRTLKDGFPALADWYVAHADERPENYL